MRIPRNTTPQWAKLCPDEDGELGCSWSSMQRTEASESGVNEIPPTLFTNTESQCNNSDDATAEWQIIRCYGSQKYSPGMTTLE